jgi:hypothetical protein
MLDISTFLIYIINIFLVSVNILNLTSYRIDGTEAGCMIY